MNCKYSVRGIIAFMPVHFSRYIKIGKVILEDREKTSKLITYKGILTHEVKLIAFIILIFHYWITVNFNISFPEIKKFCRFFKNIFSNIMPGLLYAEKIKSLSGKIHS